MRLLNNRRATLVLLVLIFSGCIVSSQDPECDVESPCSACLEQSGCGYCASEDDESAGRCIPGTSIGPNADGDCDRDRWSFLECPSLVDDCNGISSCAACASIDGCGFCFDASECRPTAEAEGCDLITNPENELCEANGCGHYSTCRGCLGDDDCGFCEALSTCHEIDDAPADCALDTGAPESCPPTSPCERVNGCDACIDDGDCGFCHASGTCHDRRDLDECELVTDSWYEPCAVPPLRSRCESIRTCHECVEDTDCGFCHEDEHCRAQAMPIGCDLDVDPRSERCAAVDCPTTESCEVCRNLNCYWCDDFGGSCHLSDSYGACPFIRWIYPWDNCPHPNTCSDHASCYSCLEESGCGWCGYLDTYRDCVPVDDLRVPYNEECPASSLQVFFCR